MIQVVDYENKSLEKINNYISQRVSRDEKFLNTIQEKKIILKTNIYELNNILFVVKIL